MVDKIELRDEETLVIQNIMRSVAGRNFVYSQLVYMKLFASTFDPNHDVMLRNTGMREVGLWLDRKIKDADPDGYIRMIGESLNDS